MRFTVLLSACVSLATIPLSSGAEFSRTYDLPPVKMGSTDLDAILLKTHAFIDPVNGLEDLGWEMVKINIDGHDIEIPHLSLASSVAFPNEIFSFSYRYNQTDKPISFVVIDLGDSLRQVSVSGESARKVEELSKLLENDFRHYSTAAGGLKFRRIAGICLSILFLSSLLISGAYCWNTRKYMGLGMPACAAIGFLLVFLVPWKRLLPGFVLYQHYSPFFLVRHAPQVFLLSIIAALVGIPLFYFLSRKE